MNYSEIVQETPVKHILHQNSPQTTHQQEEPFSFCERSPIPRDRKGETLLSFFRECHPPDIFVVMWKKGLGNVLSDGMVGMRNGNCFAFYTVFGKGNKNIKSISIGQHSQCLS